MIIQVTVFTKRTKNYDDPQISDAPSLVVSFIYNSVPQKITVKLPLTINKFFEPTEMNAESFFARWKNLGR